VPGWLIATIADVALVIVIGAIAVLYARLAPASSFARSVGVSLACAGIGIAAWFASLSFVQWPSLVDLSVPVGFLGGLAALLVSLTPRALGLHPWRAMLFSALWTVLVFVPVALATFITGIAGIMPVDHGGSLAVNVAAGAGALGVLLVPGSAPPSSISVLPPRGLGVAAVSALVTGWIAWLVAAELAIDAISIDILVNALLGTAAGAAGWLVVQRIRHQTTTLGAVAAGLVSGLVALSAGAPLMSPVAAVSIGAIAGGLACIVTLRRIEATRRQQWFLVGSHLIAAVTGLVLMGLLASGTGFAFTGKTTFLQDQVLSSAAITAYSATVALVLWLALRGRAGSRL
jgi:ammonia channel protein AmtB